MTKETHKQLAAKFSEGMSLKDYMDINELLHNTPDSSELRIENK